MIEKILLTAAFILPNFILAKSPTSYEVLNSYKTDKYEVEKDTYCNNWFISVGAGEQLLANENDKVLDVGEHIVPEHDVTVSKWLSPGIGVRAVFSGLSLQGTRIKNDLCPQQPSVHNAVHTSDQMNLHADILFSGSNLVFGYNEQRIWNVIPYANYALQRVNENLSEDNQNPDLENKDNNRPRTAVNINLDIQGIFVGSNPDENKEKKDGIFSATLALTYSLPNQKTEKVKIPIYNDGLWNKYSKSLKYTAPKEQHLTLLIPDAEDHTPQKEQN